MRRGGISFWVWCGLFMGQLVLCHRAVATAPAPWPWATPESVGMRSASLAGLLKEVRDKGARIDSITVVRKGRLVLDAYRAPFRPESRHVIHSCTKSIVSALMGIAVDRGLIQDLDRPVLDFFPGIAPENLDDRKRGMTLRHLLTMTAGIRCRDSHVYGWQGLKELMKADHWVSHILSLPMVEAPGKRFEYCNSASYLLSAILMKVTGTRTRDFARKTLFDPIGMGEVGWRSSPEGVDVGWGEMRMRAHDLARFGMLFLQKGRWQGKQVISARWVAESTRPHVKGTLFEHYGYQWWSDGAGIAMAVGYQGQYVFVVPGKDMVAVFLSSLPQEDFYLPETLIRKYLLPAVTDESFLPPDPEALARLRFLEAGWSKVPEEGLAWASREEGWAREGLFVRDREPAFRFRYPPGAFKEETRLAGQVASLRTFENDRIDVFVIPRPHGMALSAFPRAFLVPRFEMAGSDVEVRSVEKILLSCGTPACRARIDWRWKGEFLLTTEVVAAFRGDWCVYLAAHSTLRPGEAGRFLETLRFEGGAGG